MKKLTFALIFVFGSLFCVISNDSIVGTANAQYDNVIRNDNVGMCAGIGCEGGGSEPPQGGGGGGFDLGGLFNLFGGGGGSTSSPPPPSPPAPLPTQPQFVTPTVTPVFTQPTVIAPSSTCPGGTVFCGPGIRGGANLTKQNIDQNVYTGSDLKRLMIAWTRFAYPIIAILAVIAIIYAGFLYVTAFEDEGKTETAKKIIIWVVIGIILVLGAFAAVNTIITKTL